MTSTKARILLVEDYPAHREATEKLLRRAGYDVVSAPNSTKALEAMQGGSFDLAVTDLNLPDFDGIELLKRIKASYPAVEVVMLTGNATVERAVEAMRLGAYDFVEKQDNLREPLLRTVGKALERRLLSVENQKLREQLQWREAEELLTGNAPSIQAIRKTVRQIAASDVSVFIEGESGTGKELVADMIHRLSNRVGRPIIKISCAAIPETLLESEMFGYEKGAFTGANGTKQGKFELANNGTLFLDEIAEMSPALQAKLLRVLQDGRFERLGSTKELQVDMRVVSATNVDIAKAIEEKRFRTDLFYRLNVVHIVVPPLRERLEDIPLLADAFLKRYTTQMQKDIRGFDPAAHKRLASHNWPGNVRELENVIQRAVAMCAGDTIEADALVISRVSTVSPTGTAQGPSISVPLGTRLSEIESTVFEETLRQCNGDKEEAARILGISSRTLYRWLLSRQSQPEPKKDAGKLKS